MVSGPSARLALEGRSEHSATMVTASDFATWLSAWDLTPDGAPFSTEHTGSRLLPVRQRGRLCMLKIAGAPEEVRGGLLMAWWAGLGAAEVLALDGPALLLERAMPTPALPELSRSGDDRRAVEVLCDVLAELHAPRPQRPPDLLPALELWFRDLADMAPIDSRLTRGWLIAQDLLRTQQDVVILHGDMHHENVLWFGARGWLAIDPKGLLGERAYDYANIFRNPDKRTALAPGRLEARLDQVATIADLNPGRQLRWIAAHAALSAAWSLQDGRSPTWSLAVLDAILTRVP